MNLNGLEIGKGDFMKRRRFVKLLMSIGYDRNSANAIAGLARSAGSYEEYYKKHFAFRHSIGAAIGRLRETISRAADVILRAFKTA
jgi:hypothetical protein